MTAETVDAARERDELLQALGWKPGPLGEGREVILDDCRYLRPALIETRRKLEDAQIEAQHADAIMWDQPAGLLARVWRAWKDERSRRIRAERAASLAALKSPAKSPAPESATGRNA